MLATLVSSEPRSKKCFQLRFGLKTLLIVTALGGLLLGRFAYFHSKARQKMMVIETTFNPAINESINALIAKWNKAKTPAASPPIFSTEGLETGEPFDRWGILPFSRSARVDVVRYNTVQDYHQLNRQNSRCVLSVTYKYNWIFLETSTVVVTIEGGENEAALIKESIQEALEKVPEQLISLGAEGQELGDLLIRDVEFRIVPPPAQKQ